MSIHLCFGLTASVMLPPVALKLAFASCWVNSELWNWVPAGQKWGLRCGFPQHWTNRWSKRGEPSVRVLLWQLPSEMAPAVEHFVSQAEEGHRALLGAPWGCLLLPGGMQESAEFREYRWAVCWWVGRSRSTPLGKLPEYAWFCWQRRSGPLVVCLAFSFVTCHGHPSLMKYFVRVYSDLGQDLIVSLGVNKKPLSAYSFTFTLILFFLPSWFPSPNVTSVRHSRWACRMAAVMRYKGGKADPKFSLSFYSYIGTDIFQMPVSKLKMIIHTGLASP